MTHPDISLADYLAAERIDKEQHEYFDGMVRPRGLQPDDHTTILLNLKFFLDAALNGAGYDVFSSDMRVQLSPTCIVYPDVSISRDSNKGDSDDVLSSPLLVIEIFTPASVAFDLGQKARYYRACPTIQEYLLVDCERPFVHVQRRAPDGTHWAQHDYRDDAVVDLRCLGITIPMTAIYRKVQS
jgi:Uma2 family endonuclease